jgi:hypothetical protein
MVLAVLTTALAGGGWLDVPFVRQEKNGCGSASIWMIMRYWSHPRTPPVQDIQRKLYSAEGKGIYARDMERFFRDNRFRTFAFKGGWADLAEHTSRGRPLIVCLERNARGVPLHYVVVAGVDTDQDVIWINDPAERKLLPVRRADFERVWNGTGNWTLLALPEQDWAKSNVPLDSEPAIIDPSELELATDAFRAKDFPEVERHLHSALRANPADSFTNEFLATTYFLHGNLQAALKYWNRAAKPKVRDIRVDPPLHTDPVLLDHLFTFSRANVLSQRDLRETSRILDETRIFSRYEFDLTPSGAGDDFDLILRANERNGPKLLSWLGGLPYQTVYPQWWNARGKAINVESVIRWQPDTRRVFASMAGPFPARPRLGYSFQVNLRDENWRRENLFKLRRAEVAADFRAILNDRWRWANGFSAVRRSFTNALADGTSVSYKSSLERVVLSVPEKRLSVDSAVKTQLGKMFSQPAQRFFKIEAEVAASAGFGRLRLRSGRSVGELPFDELFILGLDRDGDHRLRAHPVTAGGRKGAGPMGKAYALLNYDAQKSLYDRALVGIQAGPFLDVARVSSDSRWLVDAGIQVRVSLMKALSVTVSVGKDLRNGRTAVFVDREP